MFFVTLLNHFYWFSGATMGGIFGSLIHFNTDGLEFVMTAMFVVIFMEQWLKDRRHASALLGLGLSALFAVPIRETDAKVCSVPWLCPACGGIWAAGTACFLKRQRIPAYFI